MHDEDVEDKPGLEAMVNKYYRVSSLASYALGHDKKYRVAFFGEPMLAVLEKVLERHESLEIEVQRIKDREERRRQVL